jgi:hypothetical protein
MSNTCKPAAPGRTKDQPRMEHRGNTDEAMDPVPFCHARNGPESVPYHMTTVLPPCFIRGPLNACIHP